MNKIMETGPRRRLKLIKSSASNDRGRELGGHHLPLQDYLSLLMIVLFGVLAVVPGALGQASAIEVIVDGRSYLVDGVEVRGKTASEPIDTQVVEKARFAARVLDEQLINSDGNKLFYGALTRAAIYTQAFTKERVEPIMRPILDSALAFSSSTVISQNPAIGLMDASIDVLKEKFKQWVARAAEDPREIALTLARKDYFEYVDSYKGNVTIYRNVVKKGKILSYDDAVRFQENQEKAYLIDDARRLEAKIRELDNRAFWSSVAHKIKQKLELEIIGRIDRNVRTVTDLFAYANDVNSIIRRAGALEDYQPFQEYTQAGANNHAAFERQNNLYRNGQSSRGVSSLQTKMANRPPNDGGVHLGVGTKARYSTKPAILDGNSEKSKRPLKPLSQPEARSRLLERVGKPEPSGSGIQANYNQASQQSAEPIVKKYKSIPGGVTLEGASDIGLVRSVAFEPGTNTLLLNDDIVYLNPVTPEEFFEICRAVAADDRLGVSLSSSSSIVYGTISKNGLVAMNLKLADKFLGGIVWGQNDLMPGYVWAPGYEGRRPEKSAGNIAVYFNIHDFRFTEDAGELKRTGVRVDITLVPLTEKKGEDGGHLPDFERIKKGEIPAEYEANVRHLQENIAYYSRERIVRIALAYGEVAAFARSLKSNNIDLGSLAQSAGITYASTAIATPASAASTKVPAVVTAKAPYEPQPPPVPNLLATRTYRVIDHRFPDHLNVRAKAGGGHALVGTIPHDGTNVQVERCVGVGESSHEWCLVKYGDVKGWVNKRYIAPMDQSSAKETMAAATPAHTPGSRPVVMERLRGKAFRWSGQDSRSAENFGECEERCRDTDWCAAFTYFKQSRQCRLMKGTAEYFDDPRADSGVKRGQPPG